MSNDCFSYISIKISYQLFWSAGYQKNSYHGLCLSQGMINVLFHFGIVIMVLLHFIKLQWLHKICPKYFKIYTTILGIQSSSSSLKIQSALGVLSDPCAMLQVQIKTKIKIHRCKNLISIC